MRFTDESLLQIYRRLAALRTGVPPGQILEFEVVDPDLAPRAHAGQLHITGDLNYRHRPHKTWLDLAERLSFRYMTPKPAASPFLRLRLMALDPTRTPHGSAQGKYDAQSPFAAIQKLEEPWFLADYLQALAGIPLKQGDAVLNLGVNRGDEFIPFESEETAENKLNLNLNFTGIDISQSALMEARKRFPGERFRFICADINQLPALELGRFKLIVAIGTLHSPGVDRKLIVTLIKSHLAANGAFILGFPNARYLDGEICYGARMKNYQGPELSLLVKDLFYFRRMLQQHGFQVTLTGKYYLFLTARRGR